MATEKTINTRVLLRCDELSAWQNVSEANKGGNLVLKKGEVAIALVPQGGSLAQTTPPAAMFKIGDGTNAFKDLPWASALAADVYAWAKAATKPTYSYDEITGTIPVTDTDTQYQLVLNGHTLKLQSKSKNGNWTDVSGQTFNLPDNNTTYTFAEGTTDGTFMVTPSDGPAQSVPVHGVLTSHQSIKTLNTNNTASQTPSASEAIAGSGTINLHKVSKTGSYDDLLDKPEFTTGSADGTIAVDGVDVAVKGLGSIAYKTSLSSSDVGLGSVVNKPMDASVTASSTNYITSGGVKTYVDNAISAVKQFQYEVFPGEASELPTASENTMGKIYLVYHPHGTGDSYDEYITVQNGTAYSWEKIGNTDIDLFNYVNTLSGTANSGVVTNIAKSGNTITVTSKSLATTAPNTNGTATAYIDSVSQAADGKITATKKSIPTATNSALGLVKGGTTSGKTYGVNVGTDGAMTVNVPWTDDNNNQTVKAGTVTFGADAAVNIKAGSNVTVTGSASDNSITIASSYTDTNQKVKAGSTTFGANDTVDFTTTTNGGLKVTGTNNSTTKEIKIDIDDAIVFILNGGSATTVI